MRYNTGMKKTALFSLLSLASTCSLTSCMYPYHPHNVFADSEHDLRLVQYFDDTEYLAVDEYYYAGDKYDGEITIDITVPESINGLPIKHFGRDAWMEVLTDGELVYDHDQCITNPNIPIPFCLIGTSYFGEDTIFNINIDIQADLLVFKLFESGMPQQLYFLNNSAYDRDGVSQRFKCNLNITMPESSSKYYAVDGKVYERSDSGEDEKITTKRCEVAVHGNLNTYR